MRGALPSGRPIGFTAMVTNRSASAPLPRPSAPGGGVGPTDTYQDGNELDIGAWPGLNTFASRLIASKMSLLDFINLSLEDKLVSFGLLVGSERMVRRFSARNISWTPEDSSCRFIQYPQTDFHNACCTRAAELSLPPSSEPLSSASPELSTAAISLGPGFSS